LWDSHVLNGNAGNDYLAGGSKEEELNGNAGDDILVGRSGP